MKRIIIFMFYDYEGIVDDYVKKILSSLTEECLMNKLVIVTNGILSSTAYDDLKIYTPYIYQRENKGFDGGAYKDTILMYLKDEKWDNWDELVLMNDTFYGPIYPWKNVFNQMDSQDIDFWGLTRHSGGKWLDGISFKEHIQGYFLVCRKSILSSKLFFEFWKSLDYPKTLREAVLNFEIYFTSFFAERGFKYKAYTDMFSEIYSPEGSNPYIEKMCELISEISFPIIKRKVLSVIYFSQVESVLNYIDKNTNYDIELINKHLKRLDRGKKVVPYGYMELDEFYYSHKRIYIYGKGKYGKEIHRYFIYKSWKIEKFVITDNVEETEDIISFEQLEMDSHDGIIIGLNEVYFKQVYPLLLQKVKDSQILKPRW